MKAEATLGLGVRVGAREAGFAACVSAFEVVVRGAGAGSLPILGAEVCCEGSACSGKLVREPETGSIWLLRRLSARDVDDRLLCTTGKGRPTCECRSGVPSRLGLLGGTGLGPDGLAVPVTERAVSVDAEREWVGAMDLLNFSDDLRGGGTGSASFLFDCSRSPVARTVELDDEELDDSLTAAKASRSVLDSRVSFGVTSALRRVIDCVTGGLAGLFVFGLDAGSRIGAARPGDTDDMEVGVVSRL